MQLREYQKLLLNGTRESLKKCGKTLMVLPTGGGKTVIFSYMVSRAAAKGARCVILVHRNELLDQVAETLAKFGVECTFVAAGRPYDRRVSVVVASVQTLKNRLQQVQSPRLLIVDEAHHCTPNSAWGAVIGAWQESLLVGVSATPERLSGEGLGQVFSEMVQGPTTSELIEQQALCPYEYYVPDTVDLKSIGFQAGDYNAHELSDLMSAPKLVARAVTAYEELAKGLRTIIFCVNIKHCLRVRDEYAASGYRAEVLDGTMARDERRALVRRFASGQVTHLVSCNVVSEGFDLPAIECVQLLRPTASLALFLQQVGRGLRTFPGKRVAVILDHAGNCNRHGFPDSPREWSLTGRKRSKKTVNSVTVRVCPKCVRALPAGTKKCVCGHAFVAPTDLPEESDGKLVKVDSDFKQRIESKALGKQARFKEQAKAKTVDQLVALAVSRGYKFPSQWALRIIEARTKRTTTKKNG